MTAAAVGSPCINVCRMHEASGWCEGCLRTINEIAAWSMLSDDAKRAVGIELSRRRVLWRKLRSAQPPEPSEPPGPTEPTPGP